MARGRRLLGQLGLVLGVMAAAFVGTKLGLLGTRDVGASHDVSGVPDGASDRAVTPGEQAVFLQRFLAAGTPQVVDATGRRVGRTVHAVATGATVAILVQDRWFFVPVGPDGFSLTPPTPELFFPGVTDCSGQGFFVYLNPAFTNATVSRVKAPGHTVYVADYANPRMFPPTTGSAEGWGNPPCRQVGFAGTGYPAIPLVDLDTLGFQTPFGLL